MLRIIIPEKNIHFSLLSDLSLWNDYVVSKDRYNRWLRLSGGDLNKEEKVVLRKVANALRRAPNTEWTSGIAFTPKKRIAYIEAEKILKQRFDKIVNSELKSLRRTYNFLKKAEKKIVAAQRIADTFLHSQHRPHIITLTLLLPRISGYEAWAVGRDRIVLFPPRRVSKEVLATLIHEYIHLLFRNNFKLQNRVKNILRGTSEFALRQVQKETGLTAEAVIEELFVPSLVPEGVLAKKELGISVSFKVSTRASQFEKLRFRVAQQLKTTLRASLRNTSLLENYWQHFHRIIEKELLSGPR
jgi:hypothetical protein